MVDKRNLLKETAEVLGANGKAPSDVQFCAIDKIYFTWEDFEKLADFEYDAGFGGQEVAGKLLIVGKSFWLERHEYDGSEWWEYKSLPKRPRKYKVPADLLRRYGDWE